MRRMDQDQVDSLQQARVDATRSILAAIEREARRTDGEQGVTNVLTLTRALGHMSAGWFAHAPNRGAIWTSFRAGDDFEQDEDDDEFDEDESTSSATAPDMWEIKLIVETDDAVLDDRACWPELPSRPTHAPCRRVTNRARGAIVSRWATVERTTGADCDSRNDARLAGVARGRPHLCCIRWSTTCGCNRVSLVGVSRLGGV